ncbi:MAG: hypothetical protein WHV28_08995 [Bacteroidota bacterium]
MTAAEVLHSVRMLLDDGLLWYFTYPAINSIINQAQMTLIDKYHGLDDERALRPLYVYDTNLPNNGVLSAPLLYPRAARVTVNGDTDILSWVAEYITYDVFINYNSPGVIYNTPMPRSVYWTYYKTQDANGNYVTQVLFSDPQGNATCNVLYIRVPPLYDYQVNGLASNGGPPVGLSLPEEYHPEVVLLAAELANNIDVGEMERGASFNTKAGEKLPIQGLRI